MARNEEATKAQPTQDRVFDLPGTLQRLGGNSALLKELIRVYQEDSPGLRQRLHAGVSSHQAKEIRHAAHSLRGLAANFGAAALTEILLRLEEDAAHNELDDCEMLAEQVDQESNRLETALANYQ